MKKIFGIFISVFLIMYGGGGVFAADADIYTINAKDYFRVSDFSPTISEDGTVSVFKKYDENKTPALFYNVRISAAGYYNIVLDGAFGGFNENNLYISVNGDEELSTINRVSNNFGYVYLKKGINRFEITAPGHRGLDSYLYFELKTMTLTKSDNRKIYDINPTMELGVFELSDEIGFELCFTEKNTSEEVLNYTVTDYFGNDVEYGEAQIPSGTEKYTLVLKNEYPTGWYEINADGEKASFAVLENTESKFSSPIGMDLFASYLGATDKEMDGYIRALKLMGIKNVRERIYWPGVENTKGNFDFAGTNFSINKMSEAGLSVIGLLEGYPEWNTTQNGMYNLTDIYNSAKTIAGHYLGKVDEMEFQNELDTRTEISMDAYAASYKAAAIAMDEVGMKSLSTSLALYPDYSRQYENGINLAYQNGIMDYSFAHNVHEYYDYDIGSGDDFILPLDGDYPDRRLNVTDAYSGKQKYMTETGMAIYSIDGDKKYYKADARALVAGCVNNLAQGVDKMWYFTMSRRCENGYYEFGMIKENDMPDPKLAAMAVLVKELKKARFIGTVSGLPANTYGAMFNTGEGNTAVLWSNGKSEATFHTDEEVTVTDIMGNKSVVYPIGNSITIETDRDPVYVDFGGTACYCAYYGYAEKEENHVPLNEAKKVVIQQKYNESSRDVCENGYDLGGGSRQIQTEIYNFNDFDVNVNLKSYATNGFSVSGADGNVTIPAMGKSVLNINVSSSNALSGTTGDVVIGGTLNGENLSTSVARVCRKDGSGYAALPSDFEITVNGDYNNKVLTTEMIRFTLPDNVNVDTVKVESDGKSLPFTSDGRNIGLPVSSLKRGYYKVLVTAYTDGGYAIYKAVTFCKNDL